jgi:hypothetical protein
MIMNDNAYKCAYPIGTDITQGQFAPEPGLTKREMFAAMAMQACRSRGTRYETWGDLAKDAVEIADELLEELEKTK